MTRKVSQIRRANCFNLFIKKSKKRTDVHLLIHRQGRTRGEQRSVVSLLPEKELGGGWWGKNGCSPTACPFRVIWVKWMQIYDYTHPALLGCAPQLALRGCRGGRQGNDGDDCRTPGQNIEPLSSSVRLHLNNRLHDFIWKPQDHSIDVLIFLFTVCGYQQSFTEEEHWGLMARRCRVKGIRFKSMVHTCLCNQEDISLYLLIFMSLSV